MKKLILISVLLASSSPSWALKCFKDLKSGKLSPIVIIADSSMGPYSNDFRCRNAGYARSAEEQDIFNQQALEPDYSLTKKNNVNEWVSSIEGGGTKVCDPTIPQTQTDFYKSLKTITGKMNCDNSNLKGAKLTFDNMFFQEEKLSKVQACTCMVQEGPPPKISAQFEKEQLQKISNYITEEYVGNLAPSRIYQYSLEGNILPPESVAACDQLVMDIQVQEFVKNNLEKYAPEAKTIFGKMTANDALTIYNKTQSGDTKYKAIPVITKETFAKFGAYWADTLSKAKSANSYQKLKRNLCSLTAAEKGEAFEMDLGDTDGLAAIAVEGHETVPTTLDESVERAFLEKMLCSRVGPDDKLLIDEISQQLAKNTNTPTKADIAFTDKFSKIISGDINNRCRKSEEHLGQLSKGSMAAILNDDGLIKALFGINKKDQGLVQHYYCQMMKKQLKSNPEYFLEQFCDYKTGEPLPPNHCASIGDFINTTFVYEDNFFQNNADNAKAQEKAVSTIVEGMKKDDRLSESIKRKMSDVHVDHVASFSDVTKKAASFTGPAQNGKVRVNLESYRAPEPQEVSFRRKNETTQPVSKLARYGETSAQGSGVTTAQGNNVLPSTAFTPLKIQGNANSSASQQTASAQPVITYENRNITVNQPANSPTPVASQVVASTTVIEKTVTPTPGAQKKITNEEDIDEEEIIETKKVSSHSKENTKKENAKNTNISFSSSKNSSNSSANSSVRVPSFQEASKNPSSIPEEAVRSYTEARHFDRSFAQNRVNESGHHEDYRDPVPPETGLMLSAFRTGKIGNKSLTKVTIGDEIKDLKSFEGTSTYHGPVVIVEDKTKKERYICRAIVNDLKDGSEKFIGLEAAAPKENELAGYKCTNEVIAQDTTKATNVTTVEKQEAIKTLSTNERMYKAFVLDKIIKSTNK